MAFRGYFALNNVEIVNSSRLVAHLGREVPTEDSILAPPADYSLTEVAPGLYGPPADAVEVEPGLFSITNGSRQFSPGLLEIGQGWTARAFCGDCRTDIRYDDTWPDLRTWLGDTIYRVELAPWFSTLIPESGEFGGIWVMNVKGLGPMPIDRPIVELVGSGGAAGLHRDQPRRVTFDALLFACSNAGLAYGTEWLASHLRETKARTDSTLRFLAAHPSNTAADPDDLVRELHGAVLTRELTIDDQFSRGGHQYQHATMYRVSWEITALRPYVFLPATTFEVFWDAVDAQPVRWVHAADCTIPDTCVDMPVLFSETCAPEPVDVITDPPPSCGGCMPVCEIVTYTYQVPTMTYPFRTGETAATLTVTNIGENALTLQTYWRICGTDAECEDNRFPVQISGLPAAAELTLDAVSGNYWAWYDGRKRRPVGIVSTPSGAPWRPPIIDRRDCWELVVLADAQAEFEVTINLADRES